MVATKRKGKLIVVSAPSGTGKSTICRALVSSRSDVALSISFTTRAPRGAEQDGVDYHFVNDDTFIEMTEKGAFLEWAAVHGHRYGSSKEETARLVSEGKDVLFDIDVQGGQMIKRSHPETILIYLLPPSMDQLAQRLTKRKTESHSQVQQRLEAAAWELEQGKHYDFHVINDEIKAAVEAIDRIREEKYSDQRHHPDLIGNLIHEAHDLVKITH